MKPEPARRGVVGLMAVVFLAAGCRRDQGPDPGPITFNKHIAPIVLSHCATCHRPGQTGPFPLLTYADVRNRASQIVEVTSKRYMPPWLTDGPFGEFLDDRRLDPHEIDLLRRWQNDGARQGDPKDLPPSPVFPADWPLGKPDLVVSMVEPFPVPADGQDIYRNFVVPLPLKKGQWVRATDLRPGNQAVHHVFLAFDRHGVARQWDAKDPGPGFASFTLPPSLDTPSHFLAWVPGAAPHEVQPGLAWPLETNTDLVLQIHLKPTGKPESVQPQVAFYFTDKAPTNEAMKIQMASLKITIPPGDTHHLVHTEFAIPGESEILALAPHVHFLGREITLRARLPDGQRRTLIHIPQWDFNWQYFYRYAQPPILPAGSVLEADLVYDNSEGNPRNPNHPPRLVRYGLESTDEMATIAVQLLPRGRAATEAVRNAIVQDFILFNQEFNSYLIEHDPLNVHAHVGLARSLYLQHQLEPAAQHLASARKLDPNDDDAALLSGIVAQFRRRPQEARAHFEDCIRISPDHPRAHGCLAVLALEQGWLDLAEAQLNEALRINPDDLTAKGLFSQLQKKRLSPPEP